MANGQPWQYMWVMCRSEDAIDVVYRINGENLADTQKQKASHFLEAAGLGGWVLIGAAAHGADFCASLWFKRLAS
jgi:hypothetical protein